MNRMVVEVDEIEYTVDYSTTPGVSGSYNSAPEPPELHIYSVQRNGHRYYPLELEPATLRAIEDKVAAHAQWEATERVLNEEDAR